MATTPAQEQYDLFGKYLGNGIEGEVYEQTQWKVSKNSQEAFSISLFLHDQHHERQIAMDPRNKAATVKWLTENLLKFHKKEK
uniref:Tli4_C domain-containing protein n=1 Tax=Steinernema glaseri TaxID=37863 RepID=A0A1I7ZYR1_9BILA